MVLMLFKSEPAPEVTLLRHLQAIALLETDAAGSDWVPERWRLLPTWRCTNFHVSRTFNATWHGQPRCKFECGSPVYPTFPGDHSGPLPTPETAPAIKAVTGAHGVPTQRGRVQAPDTVIPVPGTQR